MRIPVFVSTPNELNDEQLSVKSLILKGLSELNLEARTLGNSDYPAKYPLLEVLSIAHHCSGGVILGFTDFQADSGTFKKGTKNEKKINNVVFPTPWNNLEAGIFYATGLPLLIFREDGICGGVFDPGATDVFIHKMPAKSDNISEELKNILLAWQTDVRRHYYSTYRRTNIYDNKL